MKHLLFFAALLFFSTTSFEQILLEDKDGDGIVRNIIPSDDNISLIKLNTGEQSLGFNYVISTQLKNLNKYNIREFGIKAKPTEGFASVFSNNKFSPGIKFSYALTAVRIFSTNTMSKFLDWGGIDISYDINKYALFKRDTVFRNQIYSNTFKGLNLYFNYNYLVTTGNSSINSKLLFSLKFGYSRRNNYDDLNTVTIEDRSTFIDPITSIQRQIITSRSAKAGSLEEFDTYPLILSVTKLTPTDATASPNANKLRLGYTFYIKNLASPRLQPQQDMGFIFFLTKQKNGLRNPVFGLNIQANDPLDNEKLNNGLQKRISIGFTSNFTL